MPINFTGKLEENGGATMLFIAEKERKTNQLFFRLIERNRIL